ncbi:related to OSH6-member of an oxysterol-binding protein family [Sporisorium reilianum f. sp. reilianum]|uniref:Related to OSH6-member of an oxysterol-binding protein family n=1 Tax=Sporisorium reilianum f. sp. reilianum TaxID=72559 RepID=A0A2N8UDZ1_9BASI|nr:related to OSH6-member of an oxysterol-binding protein family [Sporisorium reilianum f. sp. reilianum]
MSSATDAPVATGDKDATADEIAAAPEAVQMTDDEELGAAADKDQSDSGKLKTLMGILKRMVGVKDIAAIRLSLPANLLEPVPNLEYWNYLDRGDYFTLVADLDDPLDRMLAVLRFTFTKELKYVKGKVCKPYNSVLGEHFRCHWDFEPVKFTDSHVLPVQAVATDNPEPLPLAGELARTPTMSAKKGSAPPSPLVQAQDKQSRPASIRGVSLESSNSTSSKKTLSKLLGRKKTSNNVNETQTAAAAADESESTAAPSTTAHDSASSSGSTTQRGGKRRLCFLTEQVSHHPPISSFFCEAKDAGVQLYGVDQLGAKFTGTSIRVFPGEQNQGIFLRLTDSAKCGAAGEEYQITHPTASINGLLRGSPWVAICDNLYVTCRGGKRDKGPGDDGSRLRAIVEYKDESWITKAKYALEGVIYAYGPNDDPDEYTSAKQVPQDKVLATFEGSWKGKITYKKKGDKEARLLLSINDIDPISKAVRPLSAQDEMESRRIWEPVTTAILAKKYSEATKHKQDIEQRQRNVAAERKRKGETFIPRFFDADISDGRPKLTEEGRKALDGENELVGYDGAGKQDDTNDEDEDDFQDAEN